MTIAEFEAATGLEQTEIRSRIRQGAIAARRVPCPYGPKFRYDISPEEVLRYRPQSEITRDIVRTVQALHRNGASIDEIAHAVNRTRRSIFRYLKRQHVGYDDGLHVL